MIKDDLLRKSSNIKSIRQKKEKFHGFLNMNKKSNKNDFSYKFEEEKSSASNGGSKSDFIFNEQNLFKDKGNYNNNNINKKRKKSLKKEQNEKNRLNNEYLELINKYQQIKKDNKKIANCMI